MTTIKSILEELVHPMVGTRCTTHDKHDFPELKDNERCPVCALYDELDKSVAQIEQLIDTKVISSLKHCDNEPCAKSQCKTFHLIKEDMQRELQKVIR